MSQLRIQWSVRGHGEGKLFSCDDLETTQSIYRKVNKSNILSARLANFREAAGKIGKNVKLQDQNLWMSMADFIKSHLDCVEYLREVNHAYPTKLDKSHLCKVNLDIFFQKCKCLETLKERSFMLKKLCTNLAEGNDICDIVANLAENGCMA